MQLRFSTLFSLFALCSAPQLAKAIAAGDDPCTATLLTVTTNSCSYALYDNVGATSTSTAIAPAPGCSSYSGADVWFKVIVPSNGVLTVDLTAGTITDSGMAFYTGAACSSLLTQIACDDDSGTGNMSYINLNGLTPGGTVYIRVFKYGGGTGTFNICASTPTTGTVKSSGNVSALAASTFTQNNCSNDPATSTIAVTGLATAINASFGLAEVSIRIDDNYVGYMSAYLRSPDGHIIPLVQKRGTTGINFGLGTGAATVYTRFNMASAANISAITAAQNPYTALTGYRPEGNLGVFNNGQDPNGTWTLKVCDDRGGSPSATTAGIIQSWSMTFNNAPAAPVASAPTTSDCFNATPICSNTLSVSTVTAGAGTFDDINTDATNMCLGAENNASWYIFNAQATGNFGFKILPNTATDDYDWALFRMPPGSTCSDIYTDPSLLVSCNASSSVVTSGTTGASSGSYTNQGAGTGGCSGPTYLSGCNAINALVPVTLGTTYILYITNYTAGGSGYSLNFTQAGTVGVFDNTLPRLNSVETPIVCGASSLTFNYSENVRLSTVQTSDFQLTGPGGTPYTLSNVRPACPAGSLFCNQFIVDVSPTLTATGNYVLGLAAGGSVTDNCTNNTTSDVLNFTIVIADASVSYATASACKNAGGTLTPTLAGSGGTFSATPAGLSINATGVIDVTASTAGTYTVSRTVTAGACSDTRTAIINIYNNPTPTITGANGICPAGTGASSTTLDAGAGYAAYTWTGGTATQTKTVATAGTYTVTVTQSGCTGTRSIIVSTNPVPTVSIGSPATLTCALTSTNLSATSGLNTYTWTGGTITAGGSTAAPTVTAAGTYTVAVSNTQGCTATTTVAVTQNITPPTPSLAAGAQLTCSATTPSLTATGGAPYTWSPNATSVSGAAATATAADTYTVTATAANGCTASSTVAVTQNITAPTAAINPATQLTCATTSTMLTATGGSTYAWSTGATGNIVSGVTSATPTVNAPDTYTVTVTNTINGCTSSSTVAVTQNIIAPTPSLSAAAQLTCTTTSTSLTATGGTTYAWSANATSASGAGATAITPTTYTVTATNANGCTAFATVAVTQNITAPTATAGSNNPCLASTFTLNSSGGTGYAWAGPSFTSAAQNPAVSASATVAMNGVYTVTVTGANGCTAVANIAVTCRIAPATSGKQEVCALSGTTYNVSFNVTGSAPLTVTDGSGIGGSVSAGVFTSNAIATGTVVTFTVSNACGNATVTTSGVCVASTTCNSVVGCFGPNLITDNPGFELGNTGFTSAYSANATTGNCNPGSNSCTSGVNTAYYSGPNDIICQGAYGIDANVQQCNKFWSPNIKDHTTGTGKMMMVDLPNSGSTNLWCKTIALAGSTDYCFGSYFINLVPIVNSGYGDPSFGFTANGAAIGAAVLIVKDEKWHFNGVQFRNTTAGNVTLCIKNTTAGGTGYDAALDDVSVRTINGSGTVPATVNDTKVLCAGASSVVVNVLANDGAGSGSLDFNTLKVNSAPAFSVGTISNVNKTTGEITFQPSGTFTGSTNFEYQICNTGGCCAVGTVTINAGSNPTASAGAATSVCLGSARNITASATGGSGSGYTYSWSSGAATAVASVSPAAATTYTVTVTDSNLCTNTNTVAVAVNLLPTASVGAATTTAICLNQNTALSATATGGSGAGYLYSWNDGGANPHNVNPTVNTIYTVTVTDGNTCTNTASKTITVRSLPTVTASATLPAVCLNATGTINAVGASGSGGGYTYAWDNSLGAGSSKAVTPTTTTIYNVTVTDGNSCTATDNVTVTVRSLPTANAGASRAICAGGNTSLSATASGGSGSGYTYTWNDAGANPHTVAPTVATSYTVTASDGNGCTQTNSVAITVNAIAATSITGGTAFCAGRTLMLNAGGSGTYAWSTGSTAANITVNTGGFYTVTVTDSNSCLSTASANIIVNPNPASIAVTGAAAFCAGTTTSISTNAGYAYQWSSGATTQGISVSAGGIYTVTVTDGNTCTTTATKNIALTPLPVFSISGTTAFCSGANSNLAVAGATGTYAWSNSLTTSNITVSAAGNYTVTVTNMGCAASRSVAIAVYSLPTAAISGNGSFCFGGNSLLTATGGTNYVWDAGNAINTYTATVAGTYTATVTDANGCSNTATKTVTQNSNIIPTISGPTAFCAGAGITLSTGTYNTYSWSNGATVQSSAVAAAGTYTVTVTDVAGCTGIAQTTIAANANPSTTIGGTLNFCQGNTTTLTATAGFANYQWSSGSTTAAVTVSSGNTYNVVVTDGNGCTASSQVTVIANALPTPNISGASAFCQASSNVLTASGGASYAWSTTETATAISVTNGGTYYVTATNAAGCTASANTSITQNARPVTTISSPSASSAFCSGGSLQLDAGTGFTNYAWGGANVSRFYTVNTGGTYTVTVTNGFGCTNTASLAVTMNTNPTAAIGGTAAFCAGTSTSLTATGGSTYAWSTAATTPSITATAALTYTVTVTNAAGCTASSQRAVAQNALPVPAISGVNSFCANSNTILAASGGTSYAWSNSIATANNTITTPNTYIVTVTNAAGCTASTNIAVTQNPRPLPSISGGTTVCQGKTLSLDAGSGFTSYVWSDVAATTAQNLSVTATGTYTVTVTNAFACSSATTIAVTQLVNPTPNITGVLSFCAGASTSLTAGGGNSYAWSTGANIAVITAPSASTYTVTVTSSNGCTATTASAVTQNALPNVAIASNSAYCASQTATLTASGGNTYTWSNGLGNAAAAVPTISGTYTVTATSTQGCTASTAKAVTINANPTASISGAAAFCAGGNTVLDAGAGFVSYTWNNGTMNVGASRNLTVSAAGTYTVTITDNNTCTSSAVIAIAQNANPTATITGALAFCAGSSTTLTANGGTSQLWGSAQTTPSITVTTPTNYSVVVTNAAGCTASSSVAVAQNANPTPAITGNSTTCSTTSTTLSAGAGYSAYAWSTTATTATINVSATGVYQVTVTNASNCTATASINITQFANPTININSASNILCAGSTNVLTTNAGFTTYVWTTNTGAFTGATSGASVNITAVGTYTVSATNSNGCTGTTTYAVTASALPTVSIAGAPAFCAGASTNLTASGGTYTWSTGAATALINVNTAGTYTVTVTNANGCSKTTNIAVTQNALPIPVIAGASSFCGNVGTTLTASGGNTYAWSNTTNTAANTVSSGGTYTVTVTSTANCTAVTNITVIQNALPTTTITNTNNGNLCSNATHVLTAGAGFNSYAWNNGTNTNTAIAATAGVYTVTITAVNGCTNTATAQVTTATLPTVNIGGAASAFCPNLSTTVTATGGGTYAWSNSATTAAISVNSTGTYTVTVTNAQGCTASATRVVTQNTDPVPSITGATAYCGNAGTTLTANGGTTYAWSNGTATAINNITTPNTYIVTVTNAQGCTAVTNIAVTQNALPTTSISTANGTAAFCTGNTLQLDGGAGFAAYAWSNTAATRNTTVSAAGTYTVTVTNGQNCSTTTAITITMNAPPTAAISGALSYCAGSSTSLTATGGGTYLWSNGLPSASVTLSTAGNYTVTVTSAAGCTASTQVLVRQNGLPTPLISGASAYCAGSSATLTATGGVSYAWSNGAPTDITTVNAPNTYTVIVTNAVACTATASITVSENALPFTSITTANGTSAFCTGGSLQLDGGAGFASYLWSNTTGSTTRNITINATGTYTVTVTNGQNCSTITTINITNNPLPNTAITGATAFCANSSTNLTASGGGTYAWSNGGSTSAVLSVSTTNTYTVTATTALGCTATASQAVMQNALPTPAISGNSTTCSTTATTLSAGTYAAYNWSTAATTPTINVSATGVYVVTVTNASNCTATATINITQFANPTININSASNILCAGSTNVLTTNAGFNTYVWTTNTGAFTGATSGASVSITAAGTYTVSATNSNGCTGTTTYAVTASALPTAGITGTAAFCTGSSTNLTATGGTSYAWSSSGSSATISVSTPSNYTVTVTNANGCTQTTSINVVQNALPIASITGANAFCTNSSTTLTATGGTIYAWSNSVATANNTITTPNTYIVTVTNAQGCTAVTNTAVTQNALPNTTIANTNNGNLCSNATHILTAGAGFNGYLWSNGATTNTATATTAGAYTVTITAANGCTNTATAQVTNATLPTVAISGTSAAPSFCPNGSTTVTATGGGTYAWSNGSPNAAISVSNAATYTVVVTNASGCTGTATVVVAVAIAPTATITGASAYCGNAGTTLTANGGTTYAWSNSPTTAMNVISASGTYTVTVTDANTCTASSSVAVTQNTLPTAAITSNQPTTTVCGSTGVTLTASGGNTYLWSDNTTTTAALTVTTSGNYTVTVTNAAGCTASASRNVQAAVNPTITVNGLIAGFGAFCPGQTTTLTATGGTSYLWQGAQGSNTAALTTGIAGAYTVIVTNAAGCTASTNIQVNQAQTPVPSISGNSFVCGGATATLDAGAGYSSYQWLNAGVQIGTSQTQSIATQGSYVVSVTNAAGCTGSAAISITLFPAPIISITPSATEFCAGGNVSLTATSGLNGYSWSTTQSIPNITVNAGGVYTVQASNGQGCTATATINIVQNNLPTVAINAPKSEFCAGKSLMLEATNGFTRYDWTSGGTQPIKTITIGGTYTVTVTNAKGCKNTATFAALENAVPAANAGADIVAYPGQQFQLDAAINSQWTYLWNNAPELTNGIRNIPNPTAQIQATTTYTITVTDQNGCTASDQVQVTLEDALACLGQSEGITPNGDGKNDTWDIGCLQYFLNNVQVFNRWGQVVFSAENYSGGWNADYNGLPLPDGTYYYTIKINSTVTAKTLYKGNLTILR